jgi:hypothetical protein
MSIVLLGSTSGSCTLQEQAVAGTSVLTLPVGTGTVVANNVNSAIVSGTAVASTSGTSIDFTSIPSWVKRVSVIFIGVSTSSTSNLLIQIGDSGGIETTSYASGAWSANATNAGSTIGFILNGGNTINASIFSGSIVLTLANSSSNLWVSTGVLGNSGDPFNNGGASASGGNKALSATLDRVRITTVNGTDTFDAGSINILYE